jgi:arsenate reductase
VVESMRELGVDLEGRTPRRLDRSDLEWTDHVVTMGCGDECPVVPGKRYQEWDLPDPAGKSIEEVREIRAEIAVRIDRLVKELGRSG